MRPSVSVVIALTAVALAAALFLFPLYWMFTGSFKAQVATLALPPELFPAEPTTENWRALLASNLPAWRWLVNSMLIAGLSTAVSVVVSAMAGYAFGKKRFAGSRVLFILILATMMLPAQVTLIPLYIIVRELDLYNTYLGMILPMAVSPFGIFLIRQFMAMIPNEILDAAKIDGASEWQMFSKVVWPLSGAGVAALSIFTFSAAWNNFMWQLLMAGDLDMYTLPVGVAAMSRTGIGESTILDVGLLMAGGTFGALPMIFVFILFQRHFIKGLTMGAVKG